MQSVLFFLRSTEQHIATDMFRYAACLDDAKGVPEEQRACYEHMGKRHGDIGVYAMVDNEVAGAAWVRLLEGMPGTMDGNTPQLFVGVKPKFRGAGVGTLMLEQLFHEVAALYPRISLCISEGSPAFSFFKHQGFTTAKTLCESLWAEGTPVVVMLKEVTQKPTQKPSKTYDPTYWMD